VKIFLATAQIMTKNADLTENMLYFTLKTDLGCVSRRRWNRALESSPTEIDILGEPTVLSRAHFPDRTCRCVKLDVVSLRKFKNYVVHLYQKSTTSDNSKEPNRS